MACFRLLHDDDDDDDVKMKCTSLDHPRFFFHLQQPLLQRQGRITPEAGEAKASGPGPRWGPGPPSTTKIYKVGPLWAPKLFSRHVNVSHVIVCSKL